MGLCIYVASSWRNTYQPEVIELLRLHGHQVYDFRNPLPGDNGFQWSEIDHEWRNWDIGRYRDALWHPTAERGFCKDMAALQAADLVVLLLPSGRSAHVEAAYHRGRGKPVIVHAPEMCEPELMYKMFNAMTINDGELIRLVNSGLSRLHTSHLATL